MKYLILNIAFLVATYTSAKVVVPRITNGQDAQDGQFPYQVSYQFGIFDIYIHVCGGSILSPTWVLTAGHCVTQVPSFGNHRVVAGITYLYSDNPERQEIDVIEKIVHPDFSGDLDPYNIFVVGPNDIALLKLASALEFSDFVQPINLPVAGSVPIGDVVLSGWGSNSTTIIPIMPSILQYVTVSLMTFEDCNAAVVPLLAEGEENPLSETSSICTGALTGGISPCIGDSGGPIAQEGTIVGIVSWGPMPCGKDGEPSVYTRVSSFIDFINEYVTDSS